MAKFELHLAAGMIVGGLASTALVWADKVTAWEMAGLWGACCVGGILPDIDSDNSAASRNIFTGLGFLGVNAVGVGLAERLTVFQLWGAVALTYIVIRYCFKHLFQHYTKHRGVFHSILAGLIFGLGLTAFVSNVLDGAPLISWLVGSFVFLGFLTHLVLDEIYSVDVVGLRLKHSFGTALKLGDYHNLWRSGLMILAAILLYLVAPSTDSFVNLFTGGG